MYHLGIDLGGTNIVAGIVNDKYEIVAKASCKTAVPRPETEICDSMAQLCKEVIKKAGIKSDEIKRIGIGVPGAINPETGIVEYSTNLFFHNWNLGAMMEERLKKKICIENDANAAAYGEFLAGSAKGANNSITITLGTGVGGGIIIDSKIYSGSNYAGAEMGHMVIVYDGRDCNCGRKGCWETYASATGLINMTKEAILNERADSSYMLKALEGDISKVSGRTAFDAMRNGDATGAAVVEKYIKYLGCGVVNAINIFQPDVLSIGGGISHEGETLLAPLRAYVEKERYTKHNAKQTTICAATLGNDAGIIGAAMLKPVK